MTPDAPRPDLDEAERIWREWTPSTPKSVRPLLAELTRLRAALAERDAEIARLRAAVDAVRELDGQRALAAYLESRKRAEPPIHGFRGGKVPPAAPAPAEDECPAEPIHKCLEPFEDGCHCTEPAGHPGEHVASGAGKAAYHRWPAAAPAPAREQADPADDR